MPFGVHAYTCYGCGKSDLCGDCIRSYCYECEEAMRDVHPGATCPCFECRLAVLIAESEAEENNSSTNGTNVQKVQDN